VVDPRGSLAYRPPHSQYSPLVILANAGTQVSALPQHLPEAIGPGFPSELALDQIGGGNDNLKHSSIVSRALPN